MKHRKQVYVTNIGSVGSSKYKNMQLIRWTNQTKPNQINKQKNRNAWVLNTEEGDKNWRTKKGNNFSSIALLSSQNDHPALVWFTWLWPGVALKWEVSLFSSSKRIKIHSLCYKQDSWKECRDLTIELSFSLISNYMKDWAFFRSIVFDFFNEYNGTNIIQFSGSQDWAEMCWATEDQVLFALFRHELILCMW